MDAATPPPTATQDARELATELAALIAQDITPPLLDAGQAAVILNVPQSWVAAEARAGRIRPPSSLGPTGSRWHGCCYGNDPAAQPANERRATLEASFFVRTADHSAPSGGRIDQRQNDADNAGDDEDQADRRTRHALDMKRDGVTEDRADGDEKKSKCR